MEEEIIKTTVSPSQPEVITEIPKKNLSMVILLVILGLLVVAGAVYAAFEMGKKQISPNVVAEPTITPQTTEVTPTPDETANWKTYNNKIFSFKYPALWDTYIIGENTDTTMMVAPKEKVDKVKQIQGGFGGGSFLTLTITTKTKAPVWETDESWQVTSEPIKINGIDGTKYNINVVQDLPGLGKGDKITSVVIKNDSTYVQIDLLDQTYKEIFDQILSAFKFTN